MATGEASPAPERPRAAPAGDIRAGSPLIRRGHLRSIAFRVGSVVSLVVIDLASLGVALYGALGLREIYKGHDPIFWGILWRGVEEWIWFVGLVTVLVFWQAQLYARRERRAGFGRIVSSLCIVALLVLAFGLGTGHDFDTFGLIPTTFLFATVLIGSLRASYEVASREILHSLGVRRRAILIGEGAHLMHLQRALGGARAGIDYSFVGAVTQTPEMTSLRPLGRIESLRAILAENPVDELIVTDDYGERELLRVVELAHRYGVVVRVAPKTTELLTHRADFIPDQGVPLFELQPPVLAGTDWALKRAFDIVLSGSILVIGLPVWVLVAAAIKLTSRGPVLYRDPRIGLNEQPFAMFKFRTMVTGAADRQEELERVNEASGPLFKIRDDPRVTRVGNVLRRFSIDELPNLLNVLRGEMSLVGPRPLPVRDYEQLEEWHRNRYLVLPGMTGLWQISGRSDLSFDDLVRLDFYYLENWSVWLDISILAKTIPAVLSRRGAY